MDGTGYGTNTSADYFKFALMLANLGVAPNGTRVLKVEQRERPGDHSPSRALPHMRPYEMAASGRAE